MHAAALGYAAAEWFELKMKFDESDNLLIRATRSVTDTVMTNVGAATAAIPARAHLPQAACLRRATWL